MLCANAAAQEQALSSARQQQAGAVGMLNFFQSTHVFACKASELITPEGQSSTNETLVAFD